MYSAGPWLSVAGRLCVAAASPAARNTSSDGACPTRASSAPVAANGVSATAVRRDARGGDAPVGADLELDGRAHGREVAGPSLELLVGAAGCPSVAPGMRISVRSSVGSMAVWNVSRKKSRAAISRSPAELRTTIVARVASRTAGQSDDGSAWAQRAADRPPVADLGIADPRGGFVEERIAGRDPVVGRELGVGRPATDPEAVVGLGDAVQAGDVADVDEQLRGWRAGA